MNIHRIRVTLVATVAVLGISASALPAVSYGALSPYVKTTGTKQGQQQPPPTCP